MVSAIGPRPRLKFLGNKMPTLKEKLTALEVKNYRNHLKNKYDNYEQERIWQIALWIFEFKNYSDPIKTLFQRADTYGFSGQITWRNIEAALELLKD